MMNKIILLLSITISISGCKKENDLNNIESHNYTGKVKTETLTRPSGTSSTLFYEYNKDGDLSKYGYSSSNRQFIKNLNKLTVIYYSNNIVDGQHIANLNSDDFVISEIRNDGRDSLPFWYEYDSNGFLTNLIENWQSSNDTSTYLHTQFVISEENIIIQHHTSGIDWYYEYYNNHMNTQEIYQIKGREMGGLPFYPGYHGKPNKNLIKNKIVQSDTLKYDYLFDSNGRVSLETVSLGNVISHEIEYTYY